MGKGVFALSDHKNIFAWLDKVDPHPNCKFILNGFLNGALIFRVELGLLKGHN